MVLRTCIEPSGELSSALNALRGGVVSTDLAPDPVATVQRTIEIERAGLEMLLAETRGALGKAIEQAVEIIQNATGNVIVSGMGKSGHIGRKIAATLSSTGTPSTFLHPAEASHGDLGIIRAEDVVLALSWSGETGELVDLVEYSKRFSVPLIAITSIATSTIARAADVPLIVPRAPEACPNGLAPTTSTSIQLALGDALAVALLSQRGFSAADFKRFHPGGRLGAQLKRVRDIVRPVERLATASPSESVGQAIVTMTRMGVGYILVLDDDFRLEGIITDGDIRRNLDTILFDKPVSAIMTTQPTVLPSEMLAAEALALLSSRNITAAPVVDAGTLMGAVHLSDFLTHGVA